MCVCACGHQLRIKCICEVKTTSLMPMASTSQMHDGRRLGPWGEGQSFSFLVKITFSFPSPDQQPALLLLVLGLVSLPRRPPQLTKDMCWKLMLLSAKSL